MAEHMWRWVEKEELELYLDHKISVLRLYFNKEFVPKNPIKIDYLEVLRKP